MRHGKNIETAVDLSPMRLQSEHLPGTVLFS